MFFNVFERFCGSVNAIFKKCHFIVFFPIIAKSRDGSVDFFIGFERARRDEHNGI